MGLSIEPIARVMAELIGEGLPAPSAELRRVKYAPDPPGSWCPWCGVSACAAASPNARTTACAGRQGGSFLPMVRLGAHEGDLRDWVIAIKHNQWLAMGLELGRLLGEQVRRCHPGVTRGGAVVVPVPMPWIRRLDRGIDHSSAIASGAARELHVAVAQPLRQRPEHSQVSASGRAARLSRVERFVQRGRWSAWRARAAVRGRVIVLVDDVRTTGATLSLAGAELLRLGAVGVIPTVLSVKE